MSACSPGWDRSSVYLSDLLSNPDLTSVTDPQEATKDLCKGLTGCLEGWTSEEAYFYRFDSNAQAEEFADGQEDGYHSDRIAVSFDETSPSDEQKTWIKELVDGAHSRT